MTSELLVRSAVTSFTEAKKAMESTFNVTGAPAIVRSVLKGGAPREGHCLNGMNYFVHGIGYTVIFPDEGLAHIDGGVDGDLFSIYDVSSYLETSGMDAAPDLEVLEAELEKLVKSGALRKVAARKYFVPQASNNYGTESMGTMIKRGQWMELDRPFSLWAYTVSYFQLLLRSNKDGAATRIDVGFSGVKAVLLQPRYASLVIRPADPEEFEDACRLLKMDNADARDCWAVGEFERPGYVIADTVQLHEDDGDFTDPSAAFLPAGPFSGLIHESAWTLGSAGEG